MGVSKSIFFFLFLFFFISKNYVFSNDHSFNEHIKELHEGELDAYITKNEVVLVVFYAPWCGYCKKLIPEYNEAANMLLEQKSDIKLASVNAVEEPNLAQEYEITGYPTLIMFHKKKKVNYSGGRTAKVLVEWLLRMTGPVITNIDGNIEDVLKEKNIEIAFFMEYTDIDNELYKKYCNAADTNREVAKFFSKKSEKNKIYSYKKDEDVIEYDEKTTIEDFINTESFPLFGVINADNYRFYAESPKELAWVCATVEQYEQMKAEVKLAAKELRNKVHFILLNIPEYTEHAKASLGINEFPGLAFQSNEGRFLLPTPKESLYKHNDIIEFFKNVEAGKIERSLKSEPIPKEDKDAPVKVVVGKSFIDVVLKSGKDVLIEVYAPWCGHCKQLEPIYEDLGRKLKKYENIIVAKIDGTLNETPLKDFEWSNFPTIFFVKAGTKIPLPYDGERTLKGFVDFLNKHATHTPISIDDVSEKSEEPVDEL